MKTFLVVNPGSADGETGDQWHALSAAVEKSVGRFGYGFTKGAMDAARLTRKAIQDGYECIVAVGGDGTTNEVVNGFFDPEGNVLNPRAALGLIPRGTGGDFRRAFDWDLELGAALKRLEGTRTEPLDVGRMEYTNAQGDPESRYFVNIASFGVSGLIADRVNRGTKAFGGRLSFLLGTVSSLVSYKDRPIQLSFDGAPPVPFDVTTVAVANGRYFGGGMCVAPGASTQDGLFDVTVWSGYRLYDFVVKAKGVYSGDHVTWDRTQRFQCKRITATADTETLIDCDGEVPGRLPCTMSILPAAIRLKC